MGTQDRCRLNRYPIGNLAVQAVLGVFGRYQSAASLGGNDESVLRRRRIHVLDTSYEAEKLRRWKDIEAAHSFICFLEDGAFRYRSL